MNNLKSHRLIALFILGVVLLNAPFITIFDQSEAFLGIPVLFFYLFSAWTLLIVLMILVIEYRRRDPNTDS